MQRPLLALHAVGMLLSIGNTAPARTPQDPARHLYTFEGLAAGDHLGTAVGAAGDVDGDGFADVVAGAPHADLAGLSSGSVRVYSGRDGSVLHERGGDSEADWFGFAVDGVGDLDGDGFDDFAAGSPLGTPAAGSVHVYSGRDGAVLFSFAGQAPGDRFGHAVAGVGDVDGDGVPDVGVGAPHADAGGLNAGRLEVRSGADGGVLYALAGATFDFFGFAVDAAGDADGDGLADVVVGAPLADGPFFNGGAARVLGGPAGAVLHDFHGGQIGDQLGSEVAGVGDVDGDGCADVGLGVPGADAAGIDSGAVEVRSGAGGGLLHALAGSASGDRLAAVGGVGDVDGDGLGDFVVGAASADAGGTEAGTALLIAGVDGSVIAAFHGDAPQQWLGAAVAGAGDVNADGVPDLVLGAPVSDDVLVGGGRAHVLSGLPLALAGSAHQVSVAAGGVQALTLTAPASLAGWPYLVLGSLGGTQPGQPVDGLVLPLNPDPTYFPFTLAHPNAPPLTGSLGVLGAGGATTASVAIPAGTPAALAGGLLHHAYLVLDGGGAAVFASNPVPLGLTP